MTNKFPLALFFIAFVCSALLQFQIGMDSTWDTLNYHYYLGWLGWNFDFYEKGAVAQYHTFLNPVMDMFNYLFFSLNAYFGLFYHAVFFGLLAVVVFFIAKRIFPVETVNKYLVFIFIVFSLSGVMTISLLGTMTNEDILAVFILLSLYFLLKSINEHNDYSLLACGLFMV